MGQADGVTGPFPRTRLLVDWQLYLSKRETGWRTESIKIDAKERTSSSIFDREPGPPREAGLVGIGRQPVNDEATIKQRVSEVSCQARFVPSSYGLFRSRCDGAGGRDRSCSDKRAWQGIISCIHKRVSPWDAILIQGISGASVSVEWWTTVLKNLGLPSMVGKWQERERERDVQALAGMGKPGRRWWVDCRQKMSNKEAPR